MEGLFSFAPDYGEIGRPVLLFEGFKEWYNSTEAIELRESGSTTDFVTYLADKINKMFFARYERWPSDWSSWVKQVPLTDFKQMTSVGYTGIPELLKVREGGDYKDTNISEIVGPTMQLEKFGRTFSLTYETIVNDDLGKLAEIPNMMAEAALDTLSVDIVQRTLETPGNAYDGTAFFHASHGNLNASQALSEAGVANSIVAMRSQTDTEGRKIRIMPKTLLIPPALEFVAKRILADTHVPQPGTGLTSANVVANSLTPIVEPYLTDTTDWYVLADPQVGRPAFQIGFMNGRAQPDVYLKDPAIKLLLGGMAHNPYSFEFDEIDWKVRHHWDAAPWEWRAAYKNVAP